MSSKQFTCIACGHRSKYAAQLCPACGRPHIEEDEISATRFAPAQKYLAPVDPAVVARSTIKGLEVGKYLCLVFGISTFFLLVPFCLLPVAQGPDANGYYTLPRGKPQSSPSKITGAAIGNGVTAIVIVSIGLFGGYFYFRSKAEQKKSALKEKPRRTFET